MYARRLGVVRFEASAPGFGISDFGWGARTQELKSVRDLCA